MEDTTLRFGSVCSGIEAASVAWMPLGWMPAWFSEIEPFPSALLEHHYHEIPNLGDMTTLPDRILSSEVEAPDVFCGGTPCQAFSVAGKRQSLDDERGNLSLTFCEIANAIDLIRSRDGKQPTIIFWENVPGVLNTKDNAFGCFLGELAGEDCALEPAGGRWSNAGVVFGPKRAIAWRTFDAQYFGLAQRRKRVFVVASARDGFCPAQVLFEFDGVRRDIAPSREQGQKTTGNAGEGACKSDRWPAEIASTLTASFGSKLGLENQHIDGGAPLFVPAIAFNSRQDPVSGDVFGALDTCSPQAQAIAYGCTPTKLNDVVNTITASYGQGGVDLETKPLALITQDHKQAFAVSLRGREGGATAELGGSVSPTLRASSGGGDKPHALVESAYRSETAVRRLTPVEFERLQGFPDNYTQIPWRGKAAEDCPDGHRYKALGNSWAVPNVRWIGERIAKEVQLNSKGNL